MEKPLIVSGPLLHAGQTDYPRNSPNPEMILEKLAAGETVDQILEAHPRLTRSDIQAACQFA